MSHICFAEVDWYRGLIYGLIWGGWGMVLTILVYFFKAMFAGRENSHVFEKQQGTYLGFMCLGVLMVIGGCYIRSDPDMLGAKNSDDLSSFKEFVSKDGRFRASFPGTPKMSLKFALGMPIRMFSLEEKNGVFGVAYIDIGGKEDDEPNEKQIDQMLTSARKGMLANMDAKLIKEDKIKLQRKYPGREVHAEITKGPVKGAEMFCSIYYVRGRAYQVLVMGKRAWLNSDKARKFLNSFDVN